MTDREPIEIAGTLPLDSSRWDELDRFFGDREPLADDLRVWLEQAAAAGTIRVDERRLSDIVNDILHQGTIAVSAYAVAPHFAEATDRVDAESGLFLCETIGTIEQRRVETGLHCCTRGRDPDPPDLMPAYHEAVAAAGSRVLNQLDDDRDGLADRDDDPDGLVRMVTDVLPYLVGARRGRPSQPPRSWIVRHDDGRITIDSERTT